MCVQLYRIFVNSIVVSERRRYSTDRSEEQRRVCVRLFVLSAARTFPADEQRTFDHAAANIPPELCIFGASNYLYYYYYLYPIAAGAQLLQTPRPSGYTPYRAVCLLPAAHESVWFPLSRYLFHVLFPTTATNLAGMPSLSSGVLLLYSRNIGNHVLVAVAGRKDLHEVRPLRVQVVCV